MTIDAIFSRYEVPAEIRRKAFVRGAFALALQESWVGPTITWPVLVKALVFADVGGESGHIRKKIGLDKYTATLIARGVSQYTHTIQMSSDWHQKLYLYGATVCGVVPVATEHNNSFTDIAHGIQRNLLHEIAVPDQLSPEQERILGSIEIYHYKNPSA